MIPRPRYLRTPDGVGICYQIFGDGPNRLVYLPRAAQTIGYIWEIPLYARFLERLGGMAEVMVLDVRGGGFADRVVPADRSLALEARSLDVVAAMDDAGWEHASLLGVEDGGSLCALIAAMHPGRVERLLLYGAYARGSATDDYSLGWTLKDWDAFLAVVGTKQLSWEFWMAQVAELAPSHVDDEEFARRLLLLYLSSAPSVALWEIQRDVDIRALLPSIQAPTLVVDRAENRLHVPAEGEYLAQHIPDARHVVLPGIDFEVFCGDQDALLDEVEEFLTGARPRKPITRFLTTMMFTDIVDSTRRAAVLGDEVWRDLLERHDAVVRSVIDTFGGIEVNTTGDGFVAVFDGPARAARAAQEVCRHAGPALGIEIRTGIHTGEVERIDGDIHGLAVHIAARVCALAAPSQVMATSTVKDLTAGSGLTFVDAGIQDLKGVPDRWHLYQVQ